MSGDDQHRVDYRCKHYRRNCKYIAPCCDQVYMCRICHDDKENHEMDRKQVKEVLCLKCHTKQKFQQTCEKCGGLFGKYCCNICHLLDNEDKQQFHCDKCGICRVGGQENFFHCEKCDICLSNNLKGNHKCVERVSHDSCPICLDFLHTSRRDLHIPPCGHLIHRECFDDLLQTGNYACPVCNQSLVKMDKVWESVDQEIANTQMPDEYKDMDVDILCRDCHKESNIKWHVLGLKCTHCGSYNTCRK
ncbi:RING finger and CHY zinc finger domain-containing protein 1-like [Haliotis asinina]|uniref:RING finger and CHY zinc finger domain-containing protein 1-like n=1 Tax=Haliotis asinina TaxID=109174 RepID=UPI003531950B